LEWTLPKIDERTLILGSTGSGKTTLGVWLLSQAPFHIMPYVIIDYKRDGLIAGIDRKQKIGLKDIPKEPGLYHLVPNPVSDDEAVDKWLYGIWRRQNVGLYIDEALRIPTKKSGAFETILTQGRSLHIPVISLSQRPVDLTRYAFSEANHVVAFRLTDRRDRESVSKYVPIDRDYSVARYHSLWYDVANDQTWRMPPINENGILERFHNRLAPKRFVY
jgi:DNA helicase HerA-like ATPase